MIEQLPGEVVKAWEEREGPVVLATVDGNGKPNAIYATIVKRMADGRLAVADNFFDKTLANIRAGSRASILFITNARKSYQVKGSIEYCTQGPLYEEMLGWADPRHPRKGVAVLNSEEIFRGKDRLA
jgi:predicted pyridoxine 5'-phosphate oxidase superfamily flavin-nucleotide-binding protein